jgi:hypothetical protein
MLWPAPNAERRIFVEYDVIYAVNRLRPVKRVLGTKTICIQSLHKTSKVIYTTIPACKASYPIHCQGQYLVRFAGLISDDQTSSSGLVITGMNESPVLSAGHHPPSKSVSANGARSQFFSQLIIACLQTNENTVSAVMNSVRTVITHPAISSTSMGY